MSDRWVCATCDKDVTETVFHMLLVNPTLEPGLSPPTRRNFCSSLCLRMWVADKNLGGT